MEKKVKLKLRDGDWSAFPLEFEGDYDTVTTLKMWEENCRNNNNRIIDGEFVPNHIPDRQYWLDGKEYSLKYLDALPEGATFEKPQALIDADRVEEIAQLLQQNDLASVRPLRAKVAGTSTDADDARLHELEEQAQALRVELTALQAG